MAKKTAEKVAADQKKTKEESNGASTQAEIIELEGNIRNSLADVERFERLLAAMERSELTEELLEELPELAEINARAQKLKYRAGILDRALKTQLAENEKKGIISNNNPGGPDAKKPKTAPENKVGGAAPKQRMKVNYVDVEDYGNSVLGRLSDVFQKAIKEAYPEFDVQLMMRETDNPKFGDYQCNNAMQLAQKLKAVGKATKPSEVAQRIVDRLPKCPLIEKLEVMPAGYINIRLSVEHMKQLLGDIAREGVKLPKFVRKRVVVDFSSPNIAKQMHVGHLRSTIIGDAISRLFEAVGYDVLRLNHIGDWGTQFGMLIAHLRDTYPDFLTNLPPINDLQAFYKDSKKRFDEDEEFKKRAYDCVVRLQNYEPDYFKAWQLICDISRKDFEKIYERLDIKVTERGESFYQQRMEAIIEELKPKLTENGPIRVEDGRMLFFPTECTVPLIVVKSDGGKTYDTSDLAALKQRLFEEKADWIIYVVDAGQNLHLETVYAAGRDLGWYDETKKRVEHVGFGLVLGEDKKKFKTRSGGTVKLTDLLDEGVRRAGEKLAEKERDKELSPAELEAARDAVAYGCIKYADLSHSRGQDYVFSFDRMLDDRGDTAVYLLYAYARIRSIIRTSGVSADELAKWAKENPKLPLEHPAELCLAKTILKLNDVILSVMDSLFIHQICQYVRELADTFHKEFYNECVVIEKRGPDGPKVNMGRLQLCEVTARTIAFCLSILGIREVPRM